MALRQKKFNDEEIVASLSKLDENEYKKVAKKLIERKWEDLHGTEIRSRKSKVYYFMLSKGYESDVVIALIDDQMNKNRTDS